MSTCIPQATRIGQNAVIRDCHSEFVTEEPAPGEVEAGFFAELPFASDVEQIAEQVELEDHDRIH